MEPEDQEEVYVEEPQEQPESQEEEAQKSADYNWRELRSVAQTQKMEIESQKGEIEALKMRIEELNRPKQEEPDEWAGYDPEDYAKVEHVKRSTSEVKQLKQQLAKMEQKLQITEAERVENQARSRYDDYDYVIDNFGIPMIKKNPALGQALKAMPNWAEVAYGMAKATPEYKEAQSKTDTKKAEKVIKNAERPTSINAAPSSVKKQMDAFTDLSPADVWKKSQEFARRA